MNGKIVGLMSLLIVVLWISGAEAADHVLLIGGIGGEDKYSKEFVDTLGTLRDLLVKRHGYSSENCRLLADIKAADKSFSNLSTLKNIQDEFKRLKTVAKPDDTLLLVMVGHGQSDYREPKINLPGPDLDAVTLRKLLDSVPVKDQRLILAFGCSGHFSELLANPLQTILASTDGPRQIYKPIMHKYLVEALESEVADADMDGQLSFYELFEFISEGVEGHFKSMESLQIENTSLEDNGDGKVTTLADGMDADDGENARNTFITPAPGKKIGMQSNMEGR
ncbi:hypothetical protein ACFL1X_01565 [Candidatus Hydrogenedentota bacterium]